MINLKIFEITVLLNLVKRKNVAQIFIELCVIYKYVGLLHQVPSPHLLLTRKTVIEKSPFFVLKQPRG